MVPTTAVVPMALLTVLSAAEAPEVITKEITNRKVALCWGIESCFFSFGKIESTLSWHHPQHLLKHPCSVSLPGRLPPAPPSVSPALLSLLPQAAFAESAPTCFLPGTSVVVQWIGLHASTAGGTGSIPCQGSSACHAVHVAKKKKKKCSAFHLLSSLVHSSADREPLPRAWP